MYKEGNGAGCPLNFGQAGSAWWMDASEGTASSRRECLTCLSYVATGCLLVADCVSHHFYPPMCTWTVNQKQMCNPQRFLNSLSLSRSLSYKLGVNWTVPAVGVQQQLQHWIWHGGATNTWVATQTAARIEMGAWVIYCRGTKAFHWCDVNRKLFTISTFSLRFH